MSSAVPPHSSAWIVRPQPKRPRILLAEGDELTARVVHHRLTRDGMEVTAVPDGAAALESLNVNPYDVAIIDAVLVGVDGLDLVRRIRQGEAGSAEIGIGVLCWPGNDALIARAYALNADNVMVRPLSLVALSASVARLSRRSQVRP